MLFSSFLSFSHDNNHMINVMPVYIVDSCLTQMRTGSDASTWIVFVLLIFSVIIGLTLILISAFTRVYEEYHSILVDAYHNTKQRYQSRPYTFHRNLPNAELPLSA